MATKFSATLNPSNALAADFQAWVTFIHELFTITGGWVQTSDTGQVNPATITTGGVSTVNTKFGYCIYRMDDALQATAPVFIRVDFGNGGGIANGPGMWFTIGQGSDGAGNITGVRFTPLAAASISTGHTTTGAGHNTYGSADKNRAVCSFFNHSANPARIMGFSIERTHDANGNDTPYGLIVTFAGGSTTNHRWAVIAMVVVLASVGQPPADAGLNYILPSANPAGYGSDVPVGVHIPCAGVALYPAKEVCVVKVSDFAPEASFSMTLYGNSINYVTSRGLARHACTASGTTDVTCVGATRYD